MFRSIALVAVLVLCCSIGALGGYFYLVYLAPPPETIVPNVIGLDEQAASARISAMGLRPRVESRGREALIVSGQRPEAGRMVRTGRIVTIILGKPERTGPVLELELMEIPEEGEER